MILPHWRTGVTAVMAAMLLLAAVAAGTEPVSVPAGESAGVAAPAPLDNIRVASGDGRATISWSISRQSAGDFSGVRLYRVRDGREIRYNQPVETLVEDLGLRTSWTVSPLENGEQYEFILKCYDRRQKEFWSKIVHAYPGTDPRGAPRTPVGLYASAGDGRIALFWDRNREADLVFYEIQRKGPSEREFKSVGRVTRILRVNPQRKPGNDLMVLTPTLYRDNDLTNGAAYQYRLRAFDGERKASPFSEPVTVTPRPYSPPSGDTLVLLVNSAAGDSNGNGINDSEEVAQHYAAQRKVPASRILRLALPKDAATADYVRDIQQPLKEFLRANRLTETVTTLVPCFGMPTWSGGLALDSRLADLFDRNIHGRKLGTPNPYFDSNRHFDGTYGVYQVTRLDGPTVEIAKGLVDKALAAERSVTAASGKGYLGARGFKDKLGDAAIRKTAEFGQWLGVDIVLKDPGEFREHELVGDACWYFAWYHPYRDPIQGQWPMGAVGAHLISNSFGTIREKDPHRKSWVQGLLEKGITATFGAVVEPYEQGYTRPDIFFSHFWTGEYTFAESFFMATPTVQWAMSAVGDPLFRLKKMPAKGKTPPASGGEKPSGGPS